MHCITMYTWHNYVYFECLKFTVVSQVGACGRLNNLSPHRCLIDDLLIIVYISGHVSILILEN